MTGHDCSSSNASHETLFGIMSAHPEYSRAVPAHSQHACAAEPVPHAYSMSKCHLVSTPTPTLHTSAANAPPTSFPPHSPNSPNGIGKQGLGIEYSAVECQRSGHFTESAEHCGVYDMLMLTETWTLPDEDALAIPGFSCFSSSREYKHPRAVRGRGGIALYVKSCIADELKTWKIPTAWITSLDEEQAESHA